MVAIGCQNIPKHHDVDLRDPSMWALETGASMNQTGCPEHPTKVGLDTHPVNLKGKSAPQTHCCSL